MPVKHIQYQIDGAMTGQEYPAHPPSREHRRGWERCWRTRERQSASAGGNAPAGPPRTSGARKAAPFFDGGAVKLGGTTKYRTLYALVPWSVGREHFFMDPRRAKSEATPPLSFRRPLPGEVSRPGHGVFLAHSCQGRFRAPDTMCFWHTPARGNFVPPGTTYFCRQAKVGKNWLRGCGP